MPAHWVAVLQTIRSQPEGEEPLWEVRAGRLDLLAAMDHANRGLDIPALKHVTRFCVPLHPESSVRRVGRTGQAAARHQKGLFVVGGGVGRRDNRAFDLQPSSREAPGWLWLPVHSILGRRDRDGPCALDPLGSRQPCLSRLPRQRGLLQQGQEAKSLKSLCCCMERMKPLDFRNGLPDTGPMAERRMGCLPAF
ncbi:MAG: DEAD/DEAH box helicase [Verrucomicrobiota bacterium]|nr:DEAD/DEAH box helicase [Verrucomicrobiota bacterium]